jgi:hypothetical protein
MNRKKPPPQVSITFNFPDGDDHSMSLADLWLAEWRQLMDLIDMDAEITRGPDPEQALEALRRMERTQVAANAVRDRLAFAIGLAFREDRRTDTKPPDEQLDAAIEPMLAACEQVILSGGQLTASNILAKWGFQRAEPSNEMVRRYILKLVEDPGYYRDRRPPDTRKVSLEEIRQALIDRRDKRRSK